MKRKKKIGRKTTVFWTVNLELFLLFLVLVFVCPDILVELGGIILWCLVGNASIYVGGNVMHAWQKSKEFHKEMWETVDE